MMISGTEPHGNAITGVLHASASIMTRPNGSGQSIGKRSVDAPPSSSFFLQDQRIGDATLDGSNTRHELGELSPWGKHRLFRHEIKWAKKRSDTTQGPNGCGGGRAG